MSSFAVDNPYPIFLNTDGSPLENGYIWIGEPNTDPATTPINVYWDKDLAIAAAQPIRTINGYPSRSGSPARIYVNQDFSIKIFNKNGSLVYSAPTRTDAFGINASEVSFIQVGSGVSRTVQEKLEENISAKDFGANGDGATNNTSVFSDIESTCVGCSIDLLGLIYVVDYVPNGNDYYNGAFKVGSDVTWMFSSKKRYPFDTNTNSITSLLPKQDAYRQPHGVFIRSDNMSTCHVFEEAQNHGVDVFKRFYAYKSTDFGRTISPESNSFNNLTFVYGDPAYVTGNTAFGAMGSGRFGIISSRVLPDTVTYGEPVFIYSDDDGATWSSALMPYGGSGLARSDFHGKIYPWPASAGGDDNNGFVAFSYAGSFGIVGWYTIDNGSTWTPRTNLVSIASEMSVTRIGNQDKWVMVIRAGTYGYISVSSDLVNWSTAAQLPSLVFDGNPPELIYDDGRLYFFLYSRQGKEIQNNTSNALLVSVGDPDVVFDSGGINGWSGWNVVTNLTYWPKGYLKTIKANNRWYFYFAGNEDTSGGSTGRQSVMFLLSNDISESTTSRQILHLIPRNNYIKAGQFDYWPAGVSFAASGSRQLVVPGITFARSSGVGGATITREIGVGQGAESKYVMRVRRDDGNAQTNNINLVCSLTSNDSYHFVGERVSVSFIARCGSGFSGSLGSATKFLSVKVLSSTDPQQTVTSLSGTPTNASVVATANAGVSLTSYWLPCQISLGFVPDNAEQIFVLISYNPSGTASDDWFEIEQLKIEVGNESTPFEYQSIQDVILWSNQFYQTKSVQTENGSRNISLSRMCRAPNITASVGSVSSITQNGFELSHGSAATSDIIANAFL